MMIGCQLWVVHRLRCCLPRCIVSVVGSSFVRNPIQNLFSVSYSYEQYEALVYSNCYTECYDLVDCWADFQLMSLRSVLFFLLISEDMKAYMRHTPPVYFQFSWLVFIINFMISAFVGLLIGLLHKYYSGLGVGFGLLVLLYSIQGRCDNDDTMAFSMVLLYGNQCVL